MKVVFLGTGNAFGSGGRHCVSILVEADGSSVLLDCGPAALTMMKKLGKDPARIDAVLVSHHHGDHFSGIPFLLLEYQYGQHRDRPLTLVGPAGTKEKVEQLARLLFPGLEEKPRPFSLTYREMEPGDEDRLGPFEVSSFRVQHFPRSIAFGYRLSAGGRTIVYSGDTEWTDELAKQSEGADLFICECSSFDEKIAYHMSYRELDTHRDRISARRTLLLHAGDDVLKRHTELGFELAEDGQEVRL